MRYLTATDILIIHAQIIDETGGKHDVRDIGLLASLVERPKTQFGGMEIYDGAFAKAAVYLESLARYHVFIDGNKRTAVVATARFLYLNGYEFLASNMQIGKFVVDLVVKKYDLPMITKWLKGHARET